MQQLKQKHNITVEEILLGKVSEEDILLEEKVKFDLRPKKDIYPLTLTDEVKWVNNTPELKESLRKKVQRLIVLADNKRANVITTLSYLKAISKDNDEYTIYKAFYEGLSPDVRNLNEITNRAIYLNSLLNLADSLVHGYVHSFKQFDIKANLQKDLIEIAKLFGLNLRREGGIFASLCPFHNEKNPSCKFYPQTNSFYCFGCCEGGNVINFIMKFKQCSFIDANILLQQL